MPYISRLLYRFDFLVGPTASLVIAFPSHLAPFSTTSYLAAAFFADICLAAKLAAHHNSLSFLTLVIFLLRHSVLKLGMGKTIIANLKEV
jgi:hypothetical protein